jgi:K+-sensing histidine kinase KdpD
MALQPRKDRGGHEGARELQQAVSHRLRTPLAVIKGCTEMLLAHSDEELDFAHRRQLLTVTSENIDALAEAISWVEDELTSLTSRTIRLSDPHGATAPEPGGG